MQLFPDGRPTGGWDGFKFDSDLIAMRGEITARVRQGLVPALTAGANSGDVGNHPKNEEAYDLYLRSVSMPHDSTPNKEAISMLECAVGLDSTYAPAWRALAERYYYESEWSAGEAMFRRSIAAYERALALDPNFVDAASQLVANRVETGDLVKVYKDAATLVERHPENAMAHFALSYVFRYAGILQESARECERALPGSRKLSIPFLFDNLRQNGQRRAGSKVSPVGRWFGLGRGEPATRSSTPRQTGRSAGEREEIARRYSVQRLSQSLFRSPVAGRVRQDGPRIRTFSSRRT
jgi:tetratricopeptide (TPR) repeat protein